jgi:hypothetical protein
MSVQGVEVLGVEVVEVVEVVSLTEAVGEL